MKKSFVLLGLALIIVGIGVNVFKLSATGAQWQWQENYRGYSIYKRTFDIRYCVTNIERTKAYVYTATLEQAKAWIDSKYTVEPLPEQPELLSDSISSQTINIGSLIFFIIGAVSVAYGLVPKKKLMK